MGLLLEVAEAGLGAQGELVADIETHYGRWMSLLLLWNCRVSGTVTSTVLLWGNYRET